MKICLVSARFPPQLCGVGDYTCCLGLALARIGHEVDVLTTTGELDDLLYPLPPNLRVHRAVQGWRARDLPALIRNLRRLDPQLLLIQYAPHAFDRRGLTSAVNLLPALVRVGDGIRVVTNFHEMYIPLHPSLKSTLGGLWQRAAAVLIALGSDAVCVTASEWERRLRRIGIRRHVRLIPVGSNIPRVPISDDDRARLRNRFLGGTDGVLVAGFGASHDRDIAAALYGLQRLKNERPAKLVWIGGSSPDQRYSRGIPQAMKENGLGNSDVEWTGVLPHTEVSKLLSACDLMLLPFVDGISTRRTSAVTALQHGLPLLTTRGSCCEPWFVHGENVCMSPVGDRRALADRLLELASRPELRARLAQNARALYEAHFAWDVIAQQVAGLGEEV